MASKKGVSSTRNGRDSNAQYLGIKRFAGQVVNSGEIWFANAELIFIQAPMLVAAKMTPSLPLRQEQWNLVALAVVVL